MDHTHRKHHPCGGESTEGLTWTKIIELCAICALVIIFLANAVTLKINRNLTGLIIGAIVFIATKQYYKSQLEKVP